MTVSVLPSPEKWKAALDARRTCVSVGNFDGLHVGHQRILRSVIDCAHALRRFAAPGQGPHSDQTVLAAVITFDPHPMQVLRPGQAPLLITTLEQRLRAFEQSGLDAVLVLKFNAALASLTPEEFVAQILVDTVHCHDVLVGNNFRFGHRHAGDVALLQELGRQHGFAVTIVPPVELHGQPVSSTRVRQAVQQGNVEQAEQLLARPFALTGTIEAGAHRGAKLLFPTLNLAPEQGLLPARGVYVTETCLLNSWHPSVTNVGTRPTFDGSRLTVETHLLDFSQAVRTGRMEVRFRKRLRDEHKFNSVEELKAQIARDITAAQQFFSMETRD
jgi:riboflavin kinase / FMN adenylyltransferase